MIEPEDDGCGDAYGGHEGVGATVVAGVDAPPVKTHGRRGARQRRKARPHARRGTNRDRRLTPSAYASACIPALCCAAWTWPLASTANIPKPVARHDGTPGNAGGLHDRHQDRILRLKAVLERTGLIRWTLYRKMEAGLFPWSITINVRCTGWHASAAWISDPASYRAGDTQHG